jgi:hypothetical protein
MNVEIGAEAALFPEKEYISVIFVVGSLKQNIAGFVFFSFQSSKERPEQLGLVFSFKYIKKDRKFLTKNGVILSCRLL